MALNIIKGRFFAVTLQQHKILGNTLAAHVLELFNENAGIYKVCDNLNPTNAHKWKEMLPSNGELILKLIDQIGEKNLFKIIGKGKGTTQTFFNDVNKNETLRNYLIDYVEQRFSKIFDIITLAGIPTFIKEKNFNNIYHDNLLELYTEKAYLIFRFERTQNELLYSLSASYKGEKLNLLTKNSEIISNNPCILRLNKKVLRFDEIDAKKLIPFFTKPNISIPKQTEQKYFETFVLNTIRNYEVEAEGFEIINVNPTKQGVLSFEETLSGQYAFVLKFKYGKKEYLSHSTPQREVYLEQQEGSFKFIRFERDLEWEKQVLESCNKITIRQINGSEFLPDELADDKAKLSKYSLIRWLNSNERGLAENGLSIEQRTGKVNYYIKGYDLNFKTKMSKDWFDVYGTVTLMDFEIPFLSLKKNILKGIREYTLPNGEVFVLPEEWFVKYKDIFLYGNDENGSLKIKKHHFKIISSLDEKNHEFEEHSKGFRNASCSVSVTIPDGLNADLRDYQKQGLLWLQLLHNARLNGCLADDMGLGKTLQALAMLLYSKQLKQNGSKETTLDTYSTSLIVVPTSLIFNWQKEITRFTPKLSVYLFTGQQRTKNVHMFRAFDIVLTTYGVLRNDIEMLQNFTFDYIIFDESQTIKNAQSKTYKAALQLNALNFLSLSGTPIENSLSDLWSQMNLINRGMLNSLNSFTSEYLKPIENEFDEQRIFKLKELVEPFILRRTKEQVAKDLPDLNEQIIYCNLTDEQEEVYSNEKSLIRNYIIESIDKQGYQKSNILILRALTQLRQIANHPLMVDKRYQHESGKFNEITRSIESVISEGHKILIFSSFVKHLNIIELYLKENKIGYQILTGSTTNRMKVVDDFQKDSENKVFLISIKAGGVGLNLTAADYIFVLDPWWNPAVENQAIARAHRIGQDKKVFVYRFISAGTVEEKILNLQEKKALLADRFVNQSNPLSLISREQVMEIIS